MKLPNVPGVSDKDTFIATRLPELARFNNLYALFATHHELRYKPGLQREGLEIVIRDGYEIPRHRPVREMRAVADGAVLALTALSAEIHERSVQAQKSMEKGVGPLPSDRPILAVVYAGLTAWEESLAFACSLKKQSAQVSVVMVTCDCLFSRRKLPVFQSLLERGEIDHVVVGEHCGGDDTMMAIMEGLVHQ